MRGIGSNPMTHFQEPAAKSHPPNSLPRPQKHPLDYLPFDPAAALPGRSGIAASHRPFTPESLVDLKTYPRMRVMGGPYA
jgi:hypothetical protein